MRTHKVRRLVFADPRRVRWGRRLLVGVGVLVVVAVLAWTLGAPGPGSAAGLIAGLAGALAIGFVGPGLVLRFGRREVEMDEGARRLIVRWRCLGLRRSWSQALGPRGRIVLEPVQIDLEGVLRTEHAVRYTLDKEHVRLVRSADVALARGWATAIAELVGAPLVDKSPA